MGGGRGSLRERVLAGLDAVDPACGAFITVDPDRALHDAEQAPDGPLRGLRVAVKDIIDVAGYPTTYGSPDRRDHPTVSAAVVADLTARGAVVMGKTNLNEYAFGVTGFNPHHGPILLPDDPARTAAGSSGGSAVAVAMGACDLAIGTDTSGSVRLPAAACGIWGLKTHGAMDGVYPLAPSLDTIGYLAAGPEPLQQALGLRDLPDPARVRVGHLGADLELPPLPEEHWTIFRWESYQVHAEHFARHPEAYGDDVRFKLRRERGDLAAAWVAERHWRGEVERVTTAYDALVGPVLDGGAPLLEEVLADYRSDTFTVSDRMMRHTPVANALGWPALAFPTSAGPRQVLGRPGAEPLLLATAIRLSD